MELSDVSQTHTKKRNKQNNDLNISYLTLLYFRNW